MLGCWVYQPRPYIIPIPILYGVSALLRILGVTAIAVANAMWVASVVAIVALCRRLAVGTVLILEID